MKKFFLLILISIIITTNLQALPRFALQQKDRCIDCHVNPTGGIMRNENGVFFGKNVVSMISPRDDEFPISPKLSDNISFGLDYRTQFLYSGQKKRGDFQDMTGSIYLNAGLAPKIDVLARYDFVNALWEAYGIARILPNESYIKAGSFVPNYGIRLDDHTSYTRGGDYGLLFSIGAIQGLLYNPRYIETGLELGINISDMGLFTASVGRSKLNGTLTTDPTFTTRLEINPKLENIALMFGGSFASTKTKVFDQQTGSPMVLPSQLYGGFAGFGFNRFTVLGEFDIAKDYIANGQSSNALMLEASYQLIVGLEAIARYDRFDPNTDIDKDELAHLILGFEFFPYSFVEVRPQYRINLEEPSTDNDAFVMQFHFWY